MKITRKISFDDLIKNINFIKNYLIRIMELRFKEAIKRFEALNNKKVNQQEMAEAIVEGTSGSSRYIKLSRILNGKSKNPSPDFIDQFCKYVDCDPNYLFGYDQ